MKIVYNIKPDLGSATGIRLRIILKGWEAILYYLSKRMEN
jgi:hypothetical protein